MVVIEKNSNMVHRAGFRSSVFGAPPQILQCESIHYRGHGLGDLAPKVRQVPHTVMTMTATAPRCPGSAYGILDGPEHRSNSHLIGRAAQPISARRTSP